VGTVRRRLLLIIGIPPGKGLPTIYAVNPEISHALVARLHYYNYNFRNDNYWRSFELSTGGYDKINAYARKGGKLAEELVNKASSGLSVRNAVVRYPYNCEDNGVIELLSCDY
jgi:hypothetical protein